MAVPNASTAHSDHAFELNDRIILCVLARNRRGLWRILTSEAECKCFVEIGLVLGFETFSDRRASQGTVWPYQVQKLGSNALCFYIQEIEAAEIRNEQRSKSRPNGGQLIRQSHP